MKKIKPNGNNILIVLKKLGHIFYYVLLTFVVLIAGIAALSAWGLPKQFRLFVVQTGSMEPSIKVGSVVVIKPEDEYFVGDVVTFKAESFSDVKNPNLTVTHRIFSVDENEGAKIYTTKGDANDQPDFKKLNPELILGKVIIGIPYLGYPVGFAKTQTGFILLIVIPATIIVYSELISIKNEAKRLMVERKKRKLTLKEKVEEKIGEEIINIEDELERDIKEIIK